MSVRRERVIAEIENLDQAARVEETLRDGYCEVIKDYLVHWIAAEEDVATSYDKLSQNLDATSGIRFKGMASESRENTKTLKDLITSLDTLSKQRTTRIQTIRAAEGT